MYHKDILCIAALCAALTSVSINAQTWVDISANVPGDMSQEQFANMASDGTRLYLLGDKGVFVSADSGDSFTAINDVAGGGPDLAEQVLRFIKFVNGEIWISGSGFVGSGLPPGARLHRLTPGATVWQPSSSGLPGVVGEGVADDLTHDPISGDYFITLSIGTIYVSTDGGANWLPRTNGLGGIGSPSSVVPVGGAVLTSRPLAGVLKTTDQGLNWSGNRSFGQDSIGNMIAQNGRLLITAGRTLHFSDDAGNSWHQVPNLPHGNSVLSGDGTNLFAVSRHNAVYEALAYSPSGGLSWHLLPRDGLPSVPTFLSGYYVFRLLRHGDFLFLRGITRNSSFMMESTQLHRLNMSSFNFLNAFQIVIQPQGKGLLVGQSYELEVYAAGENLTYQWQQDGVNLPGETNRSLLLPAVETADSGDYTVLVKSGAAPAVPSAVAIVTVFERAEGRWDPVFDQTDISVGGRVHLQANGEAIVVRTDTTTQHIYRIGADGGRTQVATQNNTSGNNLSVSLIDQDGRIVIGVKPGSSTSAVRRYEPNTFALLSSLFFDTGTAVRVRDLVEVPGKGYAAVGQFNTAGGLPRKDFALIGYDNVVDTNFPAGTGPNSSLDSVTVTAGGDIYAAGAFTAWSGLATPKGLARISSTGSVHAVSIGIAALTAQDYARFVYALDDGRLLVRFGPSTTTLYALNANGTQDATFNPAGHTISDIKRVAQQADGKIIIVGNFTSFGGVPAAGYIRLNPNGTVDESFYTATGFSSGTINDVTYDPRGYIYLSTANTGGSPTATFQGQGPVGRGPVRIFATSATPPGNGFAAWKSQFTFPPGLDGPEDDASGDGIKNIVVYALGGNPLEDNTARLPVNLNVPDAGEIYPGLTFTRNRNASGVNVAVAASTGATFGVPADFVETMEDLGGGVDRVTVRGTVPLPQIITFFFSVTVTGD